MLVKGAVFLYGVPFGSRRALCHRLTSNQLIGRNFKKVTKTCELVAIGTADTFLPVIYHSARTFTERVGNVLLCHAFYIAVLLDLLANKAHMGIPPNCIAHLFYHKKLYLSIESPIFLYNSIDNIMILYNNKYQRLLESMKIKT